MPQIPLDILDRIRELEDRLRAVEGRAQIRPALNQILAGDVTVGNGGTFKVNNLAGGAQFYVGSVSPNHADGTAQRGLLLYREDGSLALSVYTPDSAAQHLTLYDAHGNTILAEDVLTGGLARPWLDIPMYPARYSDFLQTTSATYDTLWRGQVSCINPKVTVSGWSWTQPGGAGNVQVLVSGVPIGSPVTVPTGAVGSWTIGPALHGVAIGSILTVEIQARLTSGPGPVYVGVHHVRGEQT